MVEEGDDWVGKLLDKLDEFGSYDVHWKGNFLEEAARILLLVSFAGRIQPGTVVDELVSHIDILATIMDYLSEPYIYKSDGTSLRRFIERTSFNRDYNEGTVVSELGKRNPVSETELS